MADYLQFMCFVCLSHILLFELIQADYFEKYRFKRFDKSKCGSYIEVKNCANINFLKNHKLTVDYNPGNCDRGHLFYNWIIKSRDATVKEVKRQDNAYLMINKFELMPGTYTVKVTASNFNKTTGSMIIDKATCKADVPEILPNPTIIGGAERKVPSGYDFKLTGKSTKNVNVKPGQPGNIVYSWSCLVDLEKAKPFCSVPQLKGSLSELKVPKQYAIDGATFRFTLSVGASEKGKRNVARQTVKVIAGYVGVDIECVENCPPASKLTNSKAQTKLEVKCTSNCKIVKPNFYTWTINDTNFDYDKNTKTGRVGTSFTINPKVLKPGESYLVNVDIKHATAKGEAQIVVITKMPPKLSDCKLTPPYGLSLRTNFKVSCTYTPAVAEEGAYSFEVFSKKEHESTMLEQGPVLEELNFLLTEHVEVEVKIIEAVEYTDVATLSALVTNSLDPNDDTETLRKTIQKVFFDEKSNVSITHLMNVNDYDKALQVIISLTNELGDITVAKPEDRNLEKHFHRHVMRLLKKIPVKSLVRNQQISEIADKIVKRYENSSDPDIAVEITDMCRAAAEKQIELMKEPHAMISKSDLKNTALRLTNCGQGGSAPNEDAVALTNATINVTVAQYPKIDEPIIEENYPDYLDDENASIAIFKFKKASDNLISLCFLNAKAISLTLNSEEVIFVHNRSFNVTALKNKGNSLMNTSIQSHGIEFRPSSDMGTLEVDVDVLMCTTTKNPFWWNKKQPIYTSIAILNIMEDETGMDLTEFSKPFFIQFEFNSNMTTEIEFLNDTTPDVDYKNGIAVHRLNIPANQPFIIEFHNLTTTLEAVVTNFEKPQLKHFRFKKKVNQNCSVLFVDIVSDSNVWMYLGVLPKDSQEVDYSFSVYSLSCNYWDSGSLKWEFACGAAKTSSIKRVDCICFHLTTIVGIVKSLHAEKEDKQQKIDVELYFVKSYTVFITLVVLYVLYLIVLVKALAYQKNLGRNMWFLGDVPSSSRYLYVVVVQTSNRFSAGTTSNVVIKLFGDKASSNDHVLNYPDPEKKLLQKDNEDWFCIGTDNYLGDLQKLEIVLHWVGVRPSWHCLNIKVFDMQEENYWLFIVRTNFVISEDRENLIYTFEPSLNTDLKDEITKKKLRTKFYLAFEQIHFWNIFKRLKVMSELHRINFIYSQVLTMCVLNLYYYGLPELKLNDCIVYILQYEITASDIAFAICSAFISYLIHFALIWILRSQSKNFKWYIFIWFFLLVNILHAMTILIIFGFWIPVRISLIWLTSTVISIAFYGLVLENLNRFVNLFVFQIKVAVESFYEIIKTHLYYIESQRTFLYEKFGEYVLRPYIQNLYEPVNHEQFNKQKDKEKIKAVIYDILEDIGMFLVYIGLLYCVILYEKDEFSYMNNKEMTDLMKHVNRSNKLIRKFGEIRTLENLHFYMTSSFIYTTHPISWYGKYVLPDPGLMCDFQNKILGVARLRQHRTIENSCKIPKRMQYLNLTCDPELRYSADHRDYGLEWTNLTGAENFSRLGYAWMYDSSYSDAKSYYGEFAFYPGAGYKLQLGRTLNNTVINYNYLLRHFWIDKQTRSVFIELLTYNVNVNLFNSVRVSFEKSATGFMERKIEIATSRFIFVSFQTIKVLVILSFIIILMLISLKLVIKIIKQKQMAWRDLWNIADIFIVVLSIVCLSMSSQMRIEVHLLLQQLHRSYNNEFVPYFSLFRLEQVLTALSAILVCVATVRLWKLLRFLIIFQTMEKTVIYGAWPLFAVFIWHVLLMICFTYMGLILFNNKSVYFRSTLGTVVTLMVLSLNMGDDFDFKIFKNGLEFSYYVVYMIATLFLVNLYISIICLAHNDAKILYSARVSGKYDVTDYLHEQYTYYSTLVRLKFKNFHLFGGADYNKFEMVTPKDDIIRYANCLTLPKARMLAMTNITKCILHSIENKGRRPQMNAKHVKLLLDTVASVHHRKIDHEHKELFFVNNSTPKVKIVHNLRFKHMAFIAENMLNRGFVKTKEQIANDTQLYAKIMNRHKEKFDFLNLYLDKMLKLVNNIDIS